CIVLGAAFSPLVVLWAIVWWRRPETAVPAIPMVGARLLFGWAALFARTVTVSDSGIRQGWWPFSTRVDYADASRIHHVSVSHKSGVSPTLAITARAGRKEIRLPMKSFSLQKRQQLVRLLVERAPGARVDGTVLTTLTEG